MILQIPKDVKSSRGRINSQGFGDEAMVAIAAANGLIPQLPNSNNLRYEKNTP